jgi:hypothetical protein|nr:MAG TPA_asm: nicotinate mononucleotide adenylyltransferase [Caudoviricetes sp.]
MGAKKENDLIEYEANGEIVKLSTSMIRKYLVSGGGNVTDQEVMESIQEYLEEQLEGVERFTIIS